MPPPIVVVVVAGGFLAVVVVVAPAPDEAALTIGVAATDEDDAFTTYHLPPANAAPSPWDCLGPESPANVYSGYELNVTCLVAGATCDKANLSFDVCSEANRGHRTLDCHGNPVREATARAL